MAVPSPFNITPPAKNIKTEVTIDFCHITCVLIAGGIKKNRRSVMSHSATPWTVARQAPPSMEFSRQEYWSGLLFPSSGNLPHPGIKLS